MQIIPHFWQSWKFPSVHGTAVLAVAQWLQSSDPTWFDFFGVYGKHIIFGLIATYALLGRYVVQVPKED